MREVIVMEFMGYDIDTANELGIEMFGEMWCLQNVLDELESMWYISLDEAEIGQGCSSKRVTKENRLYVLREFCMMIDKESGLSTQWYDDNLEYQHQMQTAIDDAWSESIQREVEYAEELRLQEEAAQLEIDAESLARQWGEVA